MILLLTVLVGLIFGAAPVSIYNEWKYIMANKSQAFKALEREIDEVRTENYRTQGEDRRLRWKITELDNLLKKVSTTKLDQETVKNLKVLVKKKRLEIINNTTSERY